MNQPDLRFDAVLALLDRVGRAREGDSGAGVAAGAVLEAYGRAVRELRAAARDARTRIEGAAATVAEARDHARLRRRRASKIAARRRSDARTDA
ncbi:MAG: hypothetical protein A3I61_09305 [Acidobacteria bacterium RIFCSPLOWO2_02_FULL_68_18]|nr:MAG: hypothetical protein A3I61_09305 [Acidobacteria bacterium RIFCSPLOWO2_02_FULL_68_18]OFW51095.1 MAG: hypothetical protein A3G77_15845 [Acidobacteria bacterium RIFCSPLOWO2_12_FULL_68_19]